MNSYPAHRRATNQTLVQDLAPPDPLRYLQKTTLLAQSTRAPWIVELVTM